MNDLGLNFLEGFVSVDAKLDESLSVAYGDQVKRTGRAEFMKRGYPSSMLEAISSIFDVPFYSFHKG